VTRDPDRRPKHAAGNGEVPPWWSALDRRRLAVALGSTFVAVPVVVFDNLPRHQEARAQANELAVVAEAPDTTTTATTRVSDPVVVQLAAAPSTTATTAAPTTTTAAPATTATTARPATTTTAAPAPPPPPPTTAAPAPPPAPAPANSESGQATWYRWRDGECAHKTLPRGTVVTVTNVANGRTATCTVTDRGPYGAGRVIDLDDGTFAQLAPLSSGVIDVTITW
jgi:rare lipoprotein A (peptidoglycan hydrolase)